MSRLLYLLLIPIASLFLLVSSTSAFDLFKTCVPEADGTQICGPCAKNPNATGCSGSGTTENPVVKIIRSAANILAIATGIAAVILIIVGGITMITSAGNAERVASGRKQIISAIVGLVIVALAWVIVSFVTERLIK